MFVCIHIYAHMYEYICIYTVHVHTYMYIYGKKEIPSMISVILGTLVSTDNKQKVEQNAETKAVFLTH